jgi:predicted nucleic acid-binding protein
VALAASSIVVDTSIVIAFVDPADAHHPRAVDVCTTYLPAEWILPISAYAESLVGPTRRGTSAVAAFEQFLSDFAIRVEPITTEIARRAASLRAAHPRLPLPDALVLTTGMVLNADAILTADSAWADVDSRVRVI